MAYKTNKTNKTNKTEDTAEVSYKIGDYAHAERIVRNFIEDDVYLRSLIANVTGDRGFAGSLNWSGLLNQGYKIREVARKMLESRQASLEKRAQSPESPKQLTLDL